ncbi:uncharacterized protein [Apostichopus japonicus]|uniref:uncharacterized protein isoform X1 n=1 Tax=Stichopus japonicus TaxID=307972 RepID=UPI003AB6BBA2
MTDENDNDEKQENGETAEASGLLEVEADETAVNSGGRAPSRAKSRGSISDQRKTVVRTGSRLSSRIESGLDKDDQRDNNSSRAPSAATFDSETTAGYDTDLEVEATILNLKRKQREQYDASGRNIYKEACRLNGVIPVSYFLRNITESELIMKHHGLGPAGTKAIAIALVGNTTIVKLNLSDNWLAPEGAFAIADMLRENCYITDLDLSDNKLGNQGAAALCSTLLQNSNLTHVTLSGNNFEDKCADAFADVILNNNKIEYLNLSNNTFGEAAGLAFGPALAENISMRQLDLSWNHIRGKGAVILAEGVGGNIGLRKLNLSWNGFGNEGTIALGKALASNNTLEELDITNNRITAEGSVLLGKGLAVIDSLKVLLIGKNPMQTAGCYAILKSVKENSNSTMEEIDFGNIQVNKDFEDLFKETLELLPNLKVKHGGTKEKVKPKPKMNPMAKLQKYIQVNNLRLVDFFNKFDKDGSMSVNYEEFEEGLLETGIDLDREEIDWLIKQFDKDGDGDIMYSTVFNRLTSPTSF